MDTATVLSTLRERDVRLWLEEDRLKCSAPMGALDPEMRATLASQKKEILAFLREAQPKRGSAAIVPIKLEGSRPPIFAVSGHGGDVFRLIALARHLDAEQPMFGVQPPGLDGSEPLASVEALAHYEIEQIRSYQSRGPYRIAGHCAGGTIAFEVAQQLIASGQQVALLALIGSPFPTMFRQAPQMLLPRLVRHYRGLTSGSLADRQRYITNKLQQRRDHRAAQAGVAPTVIAARQRVENATLAAIHTYRLRRYPGEVDLFVTADDWHGSHQWHAFIGTLREHNFKQLEIDEFLLEPHAALLAAVLQDRVGP